jgi:hypothetical protein
MPAGSGPPIARLNLDADALTRAVTLGDISGRGRHPVELLEHGVVDAGTERVRDGFEIGLVPVRGELDTVAQASSKVLHEGVGVNGVPLPDEPGRDQFDIRDACCAWAEPMIRGPFVVTPKDREPFGLCCCECDRPLLVGDLYVDRLLGMAGDTPVAETVCVACGERD